MRKTGVTFRERKRGAQDEKGIDRGTVFSARRRDRRTWTVFWSGGGLQQGRTSAVSYRLLGGSDRRASACSGACLGFSQDEEISRADGVIIMPDRGSGLYLDDSFRSGDGTGRNSAEEAAVRSVSHTPAVIPPDPSPIGKGSGKKKDKKKSKKKDGKKKKKQ